MEEDTNCTREEMKLFLGRAIAISHFPTASNENDTTDSGIVSIFYAVYLHVCAPQHVEFYPIEYRTLYLAYTN